MKKQDVIDMLDQFADDIDPDRLIDELYLRAKLEKAEQAIADGRVVSHESVVQRTQEWLK